MSKTKFLKNTSDGVVIPYIDNITDSEDLFILIHGVGSYKTYKEGITTKFQDMLSQDNISWVAFDLRGHGESEAIFSLDYSIADLLFLGNYFREKTSKNLIVLGHSLGGAVASHSCIINSQITPIRSFVRAVCLLSAPDEITGAGILGKIVTAAHFLFDSRLLKSLDAGSRTTKIGGIRFATKDLKWFLEESNLVDMSDGVREIEKLKIIIHGTDDSVVPFRDFDKYYEKSKSPKLGFIVDGCDHQYIGYEKVVYNVVVESLASDYVADNVEVVKQFSIK